MKLGIIGFQGAGKTTLFNVLTGQDLPIDYGDKYHKEANIGIARVPDERLKFLGDFHKPEKLTYATVQFVDQRIEREEREGKRELGEEFLSNIRSADALIHVVRCFEHPVLGPPVPVKDIQLLENELILADYMVVEKRLERLKKEEQRGRKANPVELGLLRRCLEILEGNKPLREFEDIATAPELRGYAFLSSEPMILVLNQDEEGKGQVDASSFPYRYDARLTIKGKLEMELSQLSSEEALEFMADFGIEHLAREELIKLSYHTLGLISFFTVGKDEVKAWTIKSGTSALKAAGVVHSDMERGFIRAEVIHYDDLIEFGSYKNAQKKGKVRLEGKEYLVKDGDIITFRFNI